MFSCIIQQNESKNLSLHQREKTEMAFGVVKPSNDVILQIMVDIYGRVIEAGKIVDIYQKYGNSCAVECESKNCIYCAIRGL